MLSNFLKCHIFECIPGGFLLENNISTEWNDYINDDNY